MFIVGNTVIHPIHGLGVVQSIADQEIMGQKGAYANIRFPMAKITVSVPADGESSCIRTLIDLKDMDKVIAHMRKESEELPARSSDRYNINIRKIKTNDIYRLAEVVRDLTSLACERKLSPKEQNMLKQTRRAIAIEFSELSGHSIEHFENEIDEICRNKTHS